MHTDNNDIGSNLHIHIFSFQASPTGRNKKKNITFAIFNENIDLELDEFDMTFSHICLFLSVYACEYDSRKFYISYNLK